MLEHAVLVKLKKIKNFGYIKDKVKKKKKTNYIPFI